VLVVGDGAGSVVVAHELNIMAATKMAANGAALIVVTNPPGRKGHL
jgi:hypothetical protein